MGSGMTTPTSPSDFEYQDTDAGVLTTIGRRGDRAMLFVRPAGDPEARTAGFRAYLPLEGLADALAPYAETESLAGDPIPAPAPVTAQDIAERIATLVTDRLDGSGDVTPAVPGWVAEVEAEQARAKTKHRASWIGAKHPSNAFRSVVLGEELGEVNRAILEKDCPNLRAELVQVAACAIAWIEHLDAHA